MSNFCFPNFLIFTENNQIYYFHVLAIYITKSAYMYIVIQEFFSLIADYN